MESGLNQVRLQVAILTCELHLPEAQSLKSKRRVIKALKDRLQARYNVSVAEIGNAEKWQRATLAIGMVGNRRRFLEQALAGIANHIERYPAIQVLDSRLEFV